MLKDIQNRHSVIVTLLSNMIPFPGNHHSQDPATAAAAAAAGIASAPQNGLYGGGGGGGGGSMAGIQGLPGSHPHQPAMNAYAHHPRDHMSSGNQGMQKPRSSINLSNSTPVNRSAVDPSAYHGLMGLDGLNAGNMTPKMKRKRRASDASSDDGANKGVEVDERGVVYMATGKKAGLKPTKIQSLVRKTIWASMGPEANSSPSPPAYYEGMAPPDGSGEWKFGNLRFEWDKTSKRSAHNALMKQIILNHIIALRAEYPEVPDADFVPARMDNSFEQAFSTWRGKVTGRVKGRSGHDDDD